MTPKIYADNAATTQLDIEAYEAMKPYLLDLYGNASQPYSFSRKVRSALNEARITIAAIINADEDEIYFTSGGSESDNWALKCFGVSSSQKCIITSQIEHHAILNTCNQMTNSSDANIIYLSVDSNGIVNLEQLEKELLKNAVNGVCKNTLVSIMMANNEIGTIEPIQNAASIAHKYGAYFHTDAVQAIGHIGVDVKELNVDMLSASSHKFNGPKGIGFLYIKRGTPIYSLINGGSQEKSLRAGTENIASIIGMATALKNNFDNLEHNQEKLMILEDTFIQTLKSLEIDFIRNGSQNHLPGLINLSIKNSNGEMLLHRMDLAGCYISTGSACDSVNNQISHVIKSIGVPESYAEGTIRISFGKNNLPEEATELAVKLAAIIKGECFTCNKTKST